MLIVHFLQYGYIHNIYIRTVNLLANLYYWYILILLGWYGAEIECTVHVALPKMTHKLV